MNTRQQKMEILEQLVSAFPTAMLVTHGKDGALHARPMMVAEHRLGERLALLTAVESNKAVEILHDERVALTFQSEHVFLSVTGKAHLEHDQEKARTLRPPKVELWAGPGDSPELCVIYVDIEAMEYWRTTDQHTLSFAWSMLHGPPPEDPHPLSDIRKHGSVSPS